MQVALSHDQVKLRDELRAYFADMMTPDVEAAMSNGEGGGRHVAPREPVLLGHGAGLKFVMNACTRVLDERLRPIAPGSGAAGRVALGGRVPLGYYNDPERRPRSSPRGMGRAGSCPATSA